MSKGTSVSHERMIYLRLPRPSESAALVPRSRYILAHLILLGIGIPPNYMIVFLSCTVGWYVRMHLGSLDLRSTL